MRARPIAIAQSLARDLRGQNHHSIGTGFTRPLSTTQCRTSRLRTRLEIPPPFPVTKTCPEPSCNCPPTPAMPEGLPLDHEHALNGTMAAYAQQLVVCTGQRDWTSRIEDDGEHQGWGSLVRGLKRLMGRRGPYLDPFNNILVTNSSIKSATANPSTASAILFPSFKYIPTIPTSATSLETFIRAFLLPKHLHNMHHLLPHTKQKAMTRAPELASHFPDTLDIDHSPTILICGHGGRDMRCGLMAPALEAEFHRVLRTVGFDSVGCEGGRLDGLGHANVGLISHVGGHKYAGNVIVYIPPKMTSSTGTVHPLAGMGIWYGRVEPKHVQGIVEETVLGGRVVTDHFRGGIDRDGNILRL
ncbi:hypothetical protein PMG11_03134 [Penicillium brasilianum]|uniref:Altered inheritance of mitochondria protein 32 n=1 Tax=Penicillium brasilianum TaxID=104259 RepID=A0A0F7VER7_PENBI|nr:hypothetical protein PMG11_03134 [Penicillium brasilianum]